MDAQELQQHVTQALQAHTVLIEDNSWRHAGHAAMAGKATADALTHIRLVVVSSQFEGVGTLDRHRMVHQALQTAFETHLHALELKVHTPQEWDTLSPQEPSHAE